MYDEEKLGTDLKQLANDAWSRKNAPILLSGLPDGLKQVNGGTNVDFRNALGGKSLKKFIKETEGRFGYKLVEHPSKKAMIGLIPSGFEYEFPAAQNDKKANRNFGGKEDGLALINALTKLSDEDLEKISIPVSIIVKLFR